ncbi:uncharacterized protein LOC144488161 [Mustelus asterias]
MHVVTGTGLLHWCCCVLATPRSTTSIGRSVRPLHVSASTSPRRSAAIWRPPAVPRSGAVNGTFEPRLAAPGKPPAPRPQLRASGSDSSPAPTRELLPGGGRWLELPDTAGQLGSLPPNHPITDPNLKPRARGGHLQPGHRLQISPSNAGGMQQQCSKTAPCKSTNATGNMKSSEVYPNHVEEQTDQSAGVWNWRNSSIKRCSETGCWEWRLLAAPSLDWLGWQD